MQGPFVFAMSGPPTISGIKKFPNPPIKAGITIKKSWLGLGPLRFPPATEHVRDSLPSYGSPSLTLAICYKSLNL